MHGRRDAMSREDDDGTFWHLFSFLDEDRSFSFQVLNDVLVMHDLLADVHRRPIQIKRLLNRHDGTINTRAVTTRSRKEHTSRPVNRHTAIVRGTCVPPVTQQPGPRLAAWHWRPQRKNPPRFALLLNS